MSDLTLVPEDDSKKITEEDIRQGREVLSKQKSFPGSSVLSNPYLTEICEMLNSKESLHNMSRWLKEKEKEEVNKECYVSTVTLSEFKKSWFDPLRKKAVESIKDGGYNELVIGGIYFEKNKLAEQGAFKQEVARATAGKNYIDGQNELFIYLNYVKERLDDDPKNRVYWAKEWRYTVETYMKNVSETAQSPELHMALLQHEINIVIEANVKTVREMFGSEREIEYLDIFEKNYKSVAAIRGSALFEDDGEDTDEGEL